MMGKSKFEKLTDRLVKMSTWKVVLLGFAMVMTITFLQQVAFHLWGTIKVEDLRYMFTAEGLEEQVHFSRAFLIGVIYVPLVETLIYQVLILKIFFYLNYEFEYKIGLPVIVSALIFGFAHWRIPSTIIDSIIKTICSSLIGLILAYSYAVFHLSDRKAIINTAIIHGLLNLYSATPALLFIRIYDMFKSLLN
ncbi:type II CAAX prenyl endopeptidase Rce1 family protein [Tissierella sp.]|uniref:CPBP family glutamic-type intramembrane protease n=1 Tax=Tissierella sp. TaxID=41274 RepID=UPI002862E317|nr:CPBP family glutamic-type intramembrane protease [Tissierella sp.]MDR7855707.1 CPBP family glutamic-type intramembrane protease [Tissierella sp.]